MIRWYPHVLETEATKQKYNSQYIDYILAYGNNLHNKKLPIIYSLAHLAQITNCSYQQLHSIVNRDQDPYKTFKIKKRSGGYRSIVIPVPYLMKVQRWINQNILAKNITHPAAYAYVKGESIKQNAEIHCGAKWLIKMDIYRFFESISERQVYKVFHNMGYTKLFSLELARLCTKLLIKNDNNELEINDAIYKSSKYKYYKTDIQGFLPQGAPTSPSLSNLVFFKIDEKITNIAKKYNCIYSRYSDDLTFSTVVFNRKKANQLIGEITRLLQKYGLKHNQKKTIIIPPGAKKIVTGLITNSATPKIKKELKVKIKNHLYYSKKYGVLEHCQKKKFRSLDGFKNHLEGLINYVKSIDKSLGNKYYEDFQTIQWPIL